MEQDLAKGAIGSVGSFDLELNAGKIKLIVAAKPSDGVSLAVDAEVDALVFIDKLAALIPGQVDDAILGVLKAALTA